MKRNYLYWLLSLMLVVSLSFVACGDDEDDTVNPDPGSNQDQQEDSSKENSDEPSKVNPDDQNTQEVAKLEFTSNKSDDQTGIVTIIGKNLSFIKEMKIGDVVVDYVIDGETLTFSAAGMPSGEQTISVMLEDANGKSIAEEYKVTIPTPAEEKIEATNFRIKANANGTINIICDVASNAKLRTFKVLEDNDKSISNFMKDSRVQEMNNSISDNLFVTKSNVFDLKDISSFAQLPVNMYKVLIETNNCVVKVSCGEEVEYKIGASMSTTGAYLSITDNKQMVLAEALECSSVDVVAMSSSDGHSVVGLMPASSVMNAKVAEKASKVVMFQNEQVVDKVTEGGVIFIESGIVCKIVSIINNADGDATIKMIIFKNVEGMNM